MIIIVSSMMTMAHNVCNIYVMAIKAVIPIIAPMTLTTTMALMTILNLMASSSMSFAIFDILAIIPV